MFICITICIINFILSLFIAEINVEEEVLTKSQFRLTKLIMYIILSYALLYGIIVIGQNNAKLFIQYRLNEVFTIDKTAIYLSFIIFASRLVRLISNLTFIKVYDKTKEKFILLLENLLFFSFVIGGCIKNSIIGVLIMSIGFLIFLGLRDPIENYLTTVLMKNTNKDEQQQAIIYFQFARKIVTFLLSLRNRCV